MRLAMTWVVQVNTMVLYKTILDSLEYNNDISAGIMDISF